MGKGPCSYSESVRPSLVLLDIEQGTYLFNRRTGPISKIAFLCSTNTEKEYTTYPLLEMFPSLLSSSILLESGIDAQAVGKCCDWFSNSLLVKRNIEYSEHALKNMNLYHNLVELNLSDGKLEICPLMFAYIIGDYSPLRRNNLVPIVQLSYSDISVASVESLLKFMIRREFPKVKDFSVVPCLLEEIHSIAQMLNELHIELYSELFKALSKLLR